MKPTHLSIILFTALAASSSGQGFLESFDEIKADSPLEVNASSGWSQDVTAKDAAPDGSAVVSEEAGYPSGNFLRLLEHGTSVIYQTGSPLWSNLSGPATFKMDIRFGGKMPIDIALHNGTTSAGLYIAINHRTNEMSLSQGGGESVFKCEKSTQPVASLENNTWYTLEIKNIMLGKTLTEPVVGKVYLYETANPARILLDGVSIVSSGGIPFSVIKTLQIRRWGDPHSSLDVDNVQLAPAAMN